MFSFVAALEVQQAAAKAAEERASVVERRSVSERTTDRSIDQAPMQVSE